MTKFSKGPYRAEQVSSNCIGILNEEGDEIATVMTDEDEVGEQEWADAALLAGAPSMYEVLSAAVAQQRASGAHFLDGKQTPNMPAWVVEAEELLIKKVGHGE